MTTAPSPAPSAARRARSRLGIALAISTTVLIAEVIGGVLAGSLALLADAGHLVTDVVGLIVALVATGIAARPATDRHTFGFQRVEVLAALVNGVLLILVSIGVAIEGVRRLLGADATDVVPLPMLAIAVLGLVANAVCLAILRGAGQHGHGPGHERGSEHGHEHGSEHGQEHSGAVSMSVRAATLEVAGDLIGSALAIIAAVVILTTRFGAADAIASLVLAALIVPRAILLLRDVVRVLTESAPRDTDVEEIRTHLTETAGVLDVHDVHVWAITSGASVFTAHVIVEPGVFERGESDDLLDRLGACLQGHFDVAHSTFQLEPAGHVDHEGPAHR